MIIKTLQTSIVSLINDFVFVVTFLYHIHYEYIEKCNFNE